MEDGAKAERVIIRYFVEEATASQPFGLLSRCPEKDFGVEA